MLENFKKGDYVICFYDKKECIGVIEKISKKGTKDVYDLRINISTKRSERPAYEYVTREASEIRHIKPN